MAYQLPSRHPDGIEFQGLLSPSHSSLEITGYTEEEIRCVFDDIQ